MRKKAKIVKIGQVDYEISEKNRSKFDFSPTILPFSIHIYASLYTGVYSNHTHIWFTSTEIC